MLHIECVLNLCMYTDPHMYMYVIYTYTHTYTDAYYIYAYVYIYIHTGICIYIHIYTLMFIIFASNHVDTHVRGHVMIVIIGSSYTH
jgi:hypothetical protein